MTKKIKSRTRPGNRARLRKEIVEMKRDQHAVGLISDVELEQTTLRMLGRDVLPKVALLSSAKTKVRKRAR